MRIYNHDVRAFLFRLPYSFPGSDTEGFRFVILRQHYAVPLLDVSADSDRIRLELRVQKAFDRGKEVVHVRVKYCSFHNNSDFFSITLDKPGKWVYNIYAIVSVSILYTRICDLSIGKRKFGKIFFRRTIHMNFAEKLRQARLDAGLSQQQLADKSGVAMRTIQNWEGAERNPSNFAKVEQIAKVLGVSTTELLDDGDSFVAEAGETFGTRGTREAKRLVADIKALFTNGEMADSDMDAFMKAVQETYWEVKAINSDKFNPYKNGKRRVKKKTTDQ